MGAANPNPERRGTIDRPVTLGSHSLRDLDIRRALRAHFAKVHAGDDRTRVFEEMELGLNAARVDLAVVNGRLEGSRSRAITTGLTGLPDKPRSTTGCSTA